MNPETWYLMDANGGIVGPLTNEVAVSLLRQRPGLFVKVSKDQQTWSAVRAQPAVQALVTAESPASRHKREEQEAQRVLFDLDRYRELKPHELFGVPATATKRELRQGFLNLAKRYAPGRLELNVAPALLKAHIAVYQYLSEVITEAEHSPEEMPLPVAASSVTPVPFSTRTPAPFASRPTPAPQQSMKQPLWRLDALKLRKDRDRLLGELDVTKDTAFVFKGHRLMNLASSSAVFFPCMPTLALGTKLEVNFHFSGRDVLSRGSVSLESTFSDDRHLRGFGVQLEKLDTETKGFMLREIAKLTA